MIKKKIIRAVRSHECPIEWVGFSCSEKGVYICSAQILIAKHYNLQVQRHTLKSYVIKKFQSLVSACHVGKDRGIFSQVIFHNIAGLRNSISSSVHRLSPMDAKVVSSLFFGEEYQTCGCLPRKVSILCSCEVTATVCSPKLPLRDFKIIESPSGNVALSDVVKLPQPQEFFSRD